MSSVSSINPGVANLLQALSGLNSPALSSRAVTAALEKAPASDIVELSAAATQLQNLDSLFGLPDSTTSSSSGLGDISSLESLAYGGSPSAGSTLLDAIANMAASNGASATDPLGQLESTLAATNPQSLFDTGAAGIGGLLA
jgi:hypothetical protein